MHSYFCPSCGSPHEVQATVSVGYADLYQRGECQSWSVGRLSCGHTVAERTAWGEQSPKYFLMNSADCVDLACDGVAWIPQGW
jgi:hypothetical protein